MAKNQKNPSASAWFVGTALKVLFLCMAITGAAVGYVWQKGEIVRLGQQIHLNEARLSQLKRNNQSLAAEIATLRSPVRLDQRVRELNLGLAPLHPEQVVRLVEPLYRPVENKPDARQLADRSDDAMAP